MAKQGEVPEAQGAPSPGEPPPVPLAGGSRQVCSGGCAPAGVSSQVCPSPWSPTGVSRQVHPEFLWAEQAELACWAPVAPKPPPPPAQRPPLLPCPWPCLLGELTPTPPGPPTSQLGGSQRERREEKNRGDLSCLRLTAERVIARPAWQFLIILSLFSALWGDSQCLAVCSERPRGAWRSGGSELPLLAVLFGARSDLSRGSW